MKILQKVLGGYFFDSHCRSNCKYAQFSIPKNWNTTRCSRKFNYGIK